MINFTENIDQGYQIGTLVCILSTLARNELGIIEGSLAQVENTTEQINEMQAGDNRLDSYRVKVVGSGSTINVAAQDLRDLSDDELSSVLQMEPVQAALCSFIDHLASEARRIHEEKSALERQQELLDQQEEGINHVGDDLADILDTYNIEHTWVEADESDVSDEDED